MVDNSGGRFYPALSTESFYDKGWCRFDYDPVLAEWVATALPSARAAIVAPGNSRWLRCGGTWFAGVNVLPNDVAGTVGSGVALSGVAVDFLHNTLGLPGFDWDRGQVSVCYPGYPQPMPSEKSTAFRYRRDRDAAHVDGLLPEGSERRRHLREHHAFILGLPMVEFDVDASPFVVWEGSHELIRSALLARFDALPPERWGDEDVTEAYHQARQRVFASCKRVKIAGRPGEAFVAHRLLLHGVAPWSERAAVGEDGRVICYFRPELSGPLAWLRDP